MVCQPLPEVKLGCPNLVPMAKHVRSGDSWAVKDGSTLMRSGSGTEFELTK